MKSKNGNNNNARSEKYISLNEASQYCPYSQEYLSLRARQGKLKADKIGRNWLTTKEWLQEYIRTVDDYSNNKNGNGRKYNHIKKEKAPREEEIVKEISFPVVYVRSNFVRDGESPKSWRIKTVPSPVSEKTYIPENLPVEVRQKRVAISSVARLVPVVRFAFLWAVVCLLLIGTMFGGKGSLVEVANDLQEVKGISGEHIYSSFQKTKENISDISVPSSSVEKIRHPEDLIHGLAKSVLRFSDSASRTTRQICQEIKLSLSTVVHYFSQLFETVYRFVFGAPEKESYGESYKELTIPKSSGEGMVVIPSTEKDQEVKARIQASFSDKVTVKPDESDTSGIIKPVFREETDQEYFYILVPFNN